MKSKITNPNLAIIKKQVNELSNALSIVEKNLNTPTIYWTGSAADLVELAYGILETKRFNHGDIEINVAINYLSAVFSYPIKDCYNTFRTIRMRTGSRTLLIDEMKEKLNTRMDSLDNGIYKKKRKY